jgi:hypothetical protein
MHTLREQQQAFARAASLSLQQCPLLSAEQQRQLYRNNWVIGLRQALAAVYPVVNKLVGDEFFAYAAQAYCRDTPSGSGNLHEFGDAFADFLARMAEVEALPYLPDVARLEWDYHSVFHAPIGQSLSLDALQAVLQAGSGEQLSTPGHGSLSWQLSPACRCLQSEYPILRIWQVNQTDGSVDDTVDLNEGGVQLALLRTESAIEFHPLSSGSYTLLAASHAGESFVQACVRALAVEPECDIGDMLQYCVQQGLITGYRLA